MTLPARSSMTDANDDFCLEDLDIEIKCPSCGNEMVSDPDTLPLAESPKGAMLECGVCTEISEWRFEGDPLTARQVPVQWGGEV